MKQLLVLTAALTTGTMAMAYDTGRVKSAPPVMEQVVVPRQVCTAEQVQVERGRSGAGNQTKLRAPARIGQVQHCATQTFVEYRPVVNRTWDTPQAPAWYGHRRQPAVRYSSTERRGNTWEDDFGDRQMR